MAVGEEIVLTAENTVLTERDTTRHAELNLVSVAMRDFDAERLKRSATAVQFTTFHHAAM